MTDNVENQTIHLLQEMRADMGEMRNEMREFRAEVNRKFDEVHQKFDDVNARIDGLTYIVTLMAADMSHQDDRLDAVETRVETLEHAAD